MMRVGTEPASISIAGEKRSSEKQELDPIKPVVRLGLLAGLLSAMLLAYVQLWQNIMTTSQRYAEHDVFLVTHIVAAALLLAGVLSAGTFLARHQRWVLLITLIGIFAVNFGIDFTPFYYEFYPYDPFYEFTIPGVLVLTVVWFIPYLIVPGVMWRGSRWSLFMLGVTVFALGYNDFTSAMLYFDHYFEMQWFPFFLIMEAVDFVWVFFWAYVNARPKRFFGKIKKM